MRRLGNGQEEETRKGEVIRGNIFLEFELWLIEVLAVLKEKSSSHQLLEVTFTNRWMHFACICKSPTAIATKN